MIKKGPAASQSSIPLTRPSMVQIQLCNRDAIEKNIQCCPDENRAMASLQNKCSEKPQQRERKKRTRFQQVLVPSLRFFEIQLHRAKCAVVLIFHPSRREAYDAKVYEAFR